MPTLSPQTKAALRASGCTETECICGGEFDDELICNACGWWPGRDDEPGELINGVLVSLKGEPIEDLIARKC